MDADQRCGDLNVAIRTFWIEDDQLHFGTGGGITWDSDPGDEWAETELKARRLLEVASGSWAALPASPVPERPTLVWLDGSLVTAADAGISTFDRGITLGEGVFETIKATGGTPFAVRRHLERLRRSAQALALDVRWSDDELRVAIDGVIAAQGDSPRLRIRITATGGSAPLDPQRAPEPRPGTLVVAAGPFEPWPPASTILHAAVAVERAQPAGRGEDHLARGARAGPGPRPEPRAADEAVFANTAGRLCEGAASNVFVVIDGRLLTPSLAQRLPAGRHAARWCWRSPKAEEADLSIDRPRPRRTRSSSPPPPATSKAVPARSTAGDLGPRRPGHPPRPAQALRRSSPLPTHPHDPRDADPKVPAPCRHFSRAEMEREFEAYQERGASPARRATGAPGPTSSPRTPSTSSTSTVASRAARRSARGSRSTMTVFPNDQFTYFPIEWAVFDEERGWIVCEVQNRLNDLGDGKIYQASNFTQPRLRRRRHVVLRRGRVQPGVDGRGRPGSGSRPARPSRAARRPAQSSSAVGWSGPAGADRSVGLLVDGHVLADRVGHAEDDAHR